jgi:hypothetical protein
VGFYISAYVRFVTGKAIIAEASWNGSYLQTSLLMGYNTKSHLLSDRNPNTRNPGIILCSSAPESLFCKVVYKMTMMMMMMVIMMMIDNIAYGNREQCTDIIHG